MRTLTLGGFLNREREFRARLNTYYAEIRDTTSDNGVRLLTYHLASHRGRHDFALNNLPHETVEHALKASFLCITPVDPKMEFCLPSFPPATVKGNDLLEEAIDRQSGLASRYRFMQTKSSDKDVQAVLTALVKVKDRDIDLMKQMLAMHYFDK
jgi:hypothetical protein